MKEITIEFPLTGEWQFLRPPGHHPYAFDFVKKNQNRTKYHPKHRLNLIFGNVKCDEYYCWNEIVYSPVGGKVIHLGKDWKDHEYTNIWKTISIWFYATYRFKPQKTEDFIDLRPKAGNYVMIETKEKHIVFLAHLKENSVQVNKGQVVKVGEQIGNVGNSGCSTAPHLHLNIFDQMTDPLKAEVLPFVFSEYDELNKNGEWLQKQQNVPKLKSYVRKSTSK